MLVPTPLLISYALAVPDPGPTWTGSAGALIPGSDCGNGNYTTTEAKVRIPISLNRPSPSPCLAQTCRDEGRGGELMAGFEGGGDLAR